MLRSMALFALLVAESGILYAQETNVVCVGGVKWGYLECDGCATIVSHDEIIGDLAFPSELSELPIRDIPSCCFAYSSNLVSVVIPPSITNIGAYAFYGCPALRRVDFSEGLKTICSGAFASCTNLVDIELPYSLEALGEEVSIGDERICIKVAEEFFDETNICSVVTNNSGIATIKCSSRLESCFYECTCVGMGVFEDCWLLTNVVMRPGLYTIGAGALRNCRRLKSVSVPSTVTRIGGYSWSLVDNQDTSISSTESYDSLEPVGGQILVLTSTSHVFRSSVSTIISTKVRGFCEGCSSLTSADLPSGLQYLGAAAFMDCKRLTAIKLPDGLDTLMEGTFTRCSRLADLHLPLSLELIGGVESFPMYESSKVSMYDSVSYDGTMSVLTSDNQRFESRSNDQYSYSDQLSINGGAPSVIYDSFDLVEQDTRWKPGAGDMKVRIDEASTNWLASSDLYAALIKAGASLSQDDLEYTERMRVLMHPSTSDYAQYNDNIDHGAWSGVFEGCHSLRSVELPESVRRIGPRSFCDCANLTAIKIPNRIQALGYEAFGGQTALRSITTPWLNYGNLHETFPSYAYVTNLVLTAGPSILCDMRDLLGPYDKGDFLSESEQCELAHMLIYDSWIRQCVPFQFFSRLRTLVLPEGLRRFDYMIGWDTLPSLQRVVFPSTLEVLDSWALNFCPVSEVVLPESLCEMHDYVFSYSEIDRVVFRGNAPSMVSGYTFSSEDECNDESLANPELNVYVYPGTTGWSGWMESNELPEDGLWPADAAVFRRRRIQYVDQELSSAVGGTGSYDAYFYYDNQEGRLVSVPQSWLSRYGLLEQSPFSGVSVSSLSPISSRSLYQSYVAGLNPLDADDEFRANLEFVDGGVKVSWIPQLSADETALRKYIVYGKANLQDSKWTQVHGDESKYNFFKVAVEMK